jgi:phosphomethylpyrimidine synthase
MELTQQVRDYAKTKGVSDAAAVETGMEEKALEFRKTREIYVPLKN